MSKAREARERQGMAAIISVDHAASLLPMEAAAARQWLRDQKLVRDLAGKAVVRWGDVYDRLAELEAPRAAVASGLKRARL